MNEINAAQRLRKAAEEKGEAEKTLTVKKAEADAESTILIPHSPGGVNGIIGQLCDAVMVGNVASETE